MRSRVKRKFHARFWRAAALVRESLTLISNRQGEQLVKAGTCTNWRYVRRSECLKWLPFDGGNGADIKAAINNGKLLYRFPFPDEDAGGANNPKTSQIINFDAINKRDMFRTFSFRCEGIEVLHQDRCIPVSVVGESAPHINIFVKCPASGNLPYSEQARKPPASSGGMNCKTL